MTKEKLFLWFFFLPCWNTLATECSSSTKSLETNTYKERSFVYTLYTAKREKVMFFYGNDAKIDLYALVSDPSGVHERVCAVYFQKDYNLNKLRQCPKKYVHERLHIVGELISKHCFIFIGKLG